MRILEGAIFQMIRKHIPESATNSFTLASSISYMTYVNSPFFSSRDKPPVTCHRTFRNQKDMDRLVPLITAPEGLRKGPYSHIQP